MKNKIVLISILVLATLLRLIYLDKFPNGLNADEAAIGYNAYSLIQTGLDEHGTPWPLVFRSFDDYKPPLYFYLVLPFVKILGLNIWAIRLPSALLGTLAVYLMYLLTKELYSNTILKNLKFKIENLSALLLAVSPWHLHFSRGGWEVNAATTLILLGVYAFIKALKNPKYFFLFTFSFLLSLYTYHSARIIAPLMALFLFIIYHPKISRTLIVSSVLSVVLSIPIANQLLSKEGQSRFSGVSIFSDTGPLSYVLESRRTSADPDGLLTKIKYNRYTAYTGYFLKNYFSHFSPNFLFINGDTIDRSRVPGFGQSYLFLAPFFYLGIILLFKQKSYLTLAWLGIAPIAAALTYQSPHALRASNMAIPLTITTAIGLMYVYSVIAKYLSSLRGVPDSQSGRRGNPVLICLFFIVLSSSVLFYFYTYYVTYPQTLPLAWQSGFSELSSYLSTEKDKYNRIIISDRYDQPYILIAFFDKTDPKILQSVPLTPRDKFGFSTIASFDKYTFKKIDYSSDSKIKNSLIIATDEVVPEEKVIYRVKSLLGYPLFKVLKTDAQ